METKLPEVERPAGQPKIRVVTIPALQCPYCDGERTLAVRRLGNNQERKCASCDRRFIVRSERMR